MHMHIFIHTLGSETMDAGSWQREDLYTGIPGRPKNVMRSACWRLHPEGGSQDISWLQLLEKGFTSKALLMRKILDQLICVYIHIYIYTRRYIDKKDLGTSPGLLFCFLNRQQLDTDCVQLLPGNWNVFSFLFRGQVWWILSFHWWDSFLPKI